MKTIVIFALVLPVGLALLAQQPAEALSITVIGHWNPDIIVQPLSAGPDAGPKSTYKSAVNQIRLRISDSSGGWRVYVRTEDTNWHKNFVLKVRKTSGEDKPTITVGDTDTLFFSGTKDTNCTLQLFLEGVSLEVSPDTYTTTLIYTVTDE